MEWSNLQEVMEQYSAFLDTTTKSNIPNNWDLKNNISFDLEVGNNVYDITFRAPEYWKYANYGRKPGRMPPVSEISKWITRRRIAPYPLSNGKLPSATSLAYVIARKIGRDGTKGNNFLEKSLRADSVSWEDKIINAIVKDITNQLTEWFSPTYESIDL